MDVALDLNVHSELEGVFNRLLGFNVDLDWELDWEFDIDWVRNRAALKM